MVETGGVISISGEARLNVNIADPEAVVEVVVKGSLTTLVGDYLAASPIAGQGTVTPPHRRPPKGYP